MKLNEYAQTILYGRSFEEKLISADLIENFTATELNKNGILFSTLFSPLFSPLKDAPLFPGRPPELVKAGKASFPALSRLHEPQVRGEVLHFFANHELLAIELMALTILKFPAAPPAFLAGIVSTIREEQDHLRLYVSRMNELGVRFGDLPVSDYFWKCLRQMQSPMDFIVQMSMTFEQANLDFALFYMKAVERVGDTKTALILEKVYREEIGHVKNGVLWFNRLRERSATESDWDAYIRLLPPPLNPSRAKGLVFCAEARRQAGLSETYIRELEVYSGSKGRPSILWLFNPSCDSEIARGKPGYTPPGGSQRFTQDLEHLPMYLALDKDIVLVERKPRTEWIASIQGAGFTTPEFILRKKGIQQSVRVSKIGGMEPWGWSPDSFEAFRPLRNRIVRVSGGNGLWCSQMLKNENFQQAGLGRFFSKEWSVRFLQDWMAGAPAAVQEYFGPTETVGAMYPTWDSVEFRLCQLFSQNKTAMVKAPYGTAGKQVRHVSTLTELQGKVGGWIRNILHDQGSVIIEDKLNKIYDLSIQIEIRDETVELLDIRRFITGSQNEYRGTYLGKKLTGFAKPDLHAIHTLFSNWRPFVADLGRRLQTEGYRGPAGVDALIWRDPQGKLKLKPLVELNPRWTMGRVALELEKKLKPGVQGLWAFLPVRAIQKQGYETAEHFAKKFIERYPLKLAEVGGGERRIESGAFFTNDPSLAQEVLTVLAVVSDTEMADLNQFWTR